MSEISEVNTTELALAGKQVEETSEVEIVESRYILRFNKPYYFEGEVYNVIDLSGIEDIEASDMISAQKVISRGGNVDILPEMSLHYACILATKVSGQPLEFFTRLPGRDAIKLKNIVTGFLYGAD